MESFDTRTTLTDKRSRRRVVMGVRAPLLTNSTARVQGHRWALPRVHFHGACFIAGFPEKRSGNESLPLRAASDKPCCFAVFDTRFPRANFRVREGQRCPNPFGYNSFCWNSIWSWRKSFCESASRSRVHRLCLFLFFFVERCRFVKETPGTVLPGSLFRRQSSK